MQTIIAIAGHRETRQRLRQSALGYFGPHFLRPITATSWRGKDLYVVDGNVRVVSISNVLQSTNLEATIL